MRALPSGIQTRLIIGLVDSWGDLAALLKKGRLFPLDGLLSAES